VNTSRRALHAAALLAVGAALVLAGCSPMPGIGEATTEETYALGTAAAAKGDHLLAIEAMNRVLSQSPLHELADDALLALAESHRAMRDFASAETEYGRLSTDYPRSPLVPEASYRLGLAYYDQSLPAALDQTMTARAIEQLELFLAEYPDSPSAAAAREKLAELRSRLAEKMYESARLYVTLKSGAPARVYFEAVSRDYPDTPWAPRALLAQARSAAGDGLPDEARGAYERLIQLYPESEEAKAAALEVSGP
jgi:outer membrane protein assembly factor BamD